MIDGANSHRLFQRLSLDRSGRSIFVSDFSLNRRILKKRKHFSGSQVVDLVADRRERERERGSPVELLRAWFHYLISAPTFSSSRRSSKSTPKPTPALPSIIILSHWFKSPV
ncbi:hypothetical protein ACMYSQ_003906 [Aspergillus niger]